MSKNLSPIRPAMTAIAAVMALSSTSVLAQTTDSTAPAAPVVVAPPPPTVTAPPTVAQTAAPEPAPAAVVAPAAPAAAMKTVGTPVVHEADTTSGASETTTAPARTAPAKRITTASAVRTSVPVAAAPVARTKADTAPAPLPTATAESVPTPADTAAAAPAGAPAATATKTTHTTAQDDTLPIAGGIGLAVIALGGVAFAMRRRREDEVVTETAPVETVAVPEAEPVVVAPKAVAPAPIAAAATPRTLPNGFDISRFGRHTQAAYLGPTSDNPSHSLKRRLKRASFFDQREREAAEAGHPIAQAPIEAPVQQAARAVQDDGQVTVRLAPQRKSGGFGYIFQR